LTGAELGCARKERILGAGAEVIKEETDEVEATEAEAGVGTGEAKKGLDIKDPPPRKRKAGT